METELEYINRKIANKYAEMSEAHRRRDYRSETRISQELDSLKSQRKHLEQNLDHLIGQLWGPKCTR